MRAAIVVAGLSGCWSGTASAPVAPTPKSVAPVASGGAEYGRAIEDPLGFMPGYANLIVGIEVAPLRDSALWQRYAPQLRTLAKLDALVAPSCIAMYDTMDSITMGLAFEGLDSISGVVVLRGVTFDQTRDCLAHSQDTSFRVLPNKRLESKTGKGVAYLQFVDAHTAVSVAGGNTKEADLDAVLANPADARKKGELAGTIDGLLAGGAPHGVWGAMTPSPEITKELAKTFGNAAPELVFGTIDVTGEIALTAHARFSSAQTAIDLQQKAAPNLSTLHMFLAKVDITVADRDLVLDVRATQQNIDSIAGMLGGMLGGAGTNPNTKPALPPAQQWGPPTTP